MTLNKRQCHFHDNYVHQIKTKSKEQLLCFVRGGAGVGKTMLTQSTIQLHLQQAGNPDNLVVALMAPTGRAVFNMGGVTVHTGLHIFYQNEENQLNADSINRAELCRVRLFIFDEVSMIGRMMFSKILQVSPYAGGSKQAPTRHCITTSLLVYIRPLKFAAVFSNCERCQTNTTQYQCI